MNEHQMSPEQALRIKRGEVTYDDLDTEIITLTATAAYFSDGLSECDDEPVTEEMTHSESVLRKAGLKKADDYTDKMMDLMVQLHSVTGQMIKLHIERTQQNDTIKH